jgi:hypothetical protein
VSTLSRLNCIFVGLIGLSLIALAACGRPDSSPSGVVAAVAAPASSGQVWEVDVAGGRAASPAAVLAFVQGLHVMVIDGNRVYAGLTPLKVAPGADGILTITLRGNLTAQIVPAGTGLQLRFSSGEAIALREQPARKTE